MPVLQGIRASCLPLTKPATRACEIDMTESVSTLPWGGLAVDAEGNVYLRGAKLELAPKELAVLHRLLVRWPNVVRKDEFLQHIWAGRMMSDESLARCVAQARKALAAVPGVAIKALYGQGYCIERSGGPHMPVPLHQTAFHRRLMDIAQAPSLLAETVSHCESLIHLRTRFSLQQSEQLLRTVLQQDGNYLAALKMIKMQGGVFGAVATSDAFIQALA